MAAKYQDNRSVKISSPFGANVLLFARMAVAERISQPFHAEISLLSEKPDLDADEILGKPLAVSVDTGHFERHFHGLVTEFEQTGYVERFHQYRAVIRPWYWLLTRTAEVLEQNGVLGYMLYVDEKLAEEEDRAKRYLDPTDGESQAKVGIFY